MKMFGKIILVTSSVMLMGCQMSAGGGLGTNVRPISSDMRMGSYDWEWYKDIPRNSWSYNVVDTDARSGTRSQRLELRNGDCTSKSPYNSNWGCEHDRERVELTNTVWPVGRDKWLGLSIKIDDAWEISQKEHCTSIFQIKQYEKNVHQGIQPENKTGNYNNGHYVGNHALFHGSICGRRIGMALSEVGFETSKFQGWRKQKWIELANISQVKGQWIDIAIRWDTTDYRDEQSTLEFYVNGEHVFTEHNLTNNFFPEDYAFKYGMYRSYMKKQGVKTGTQIAWFDEVRHGDSLESVSPNSNPAVD